MAIYNRPTAVMTDNSLNSTQIMGKFSGRATVIMPNSNMQAVALSPALSVGSNIDGYEIQSVIAENTGEATLLMAKNNEKLFVLKIYHQNKRPKPELLEAIKNLKCLYTISYLESGEYEDRFYEVLPYFKNGDLANSLPISIKELEEIVIPCINEGLFALHSVGIVHRDIKPNNIFFNDDKTKVIIGDFGISSLLGSKMSVRATSMSRTLGYAAPETSTGFISKESDYYSLGIALLHMILGQDPFLGMSEMQILYQTINKKIDIPKSINLRIAMLIKGLTIKEREDRWGYDEIKRWLNKEDIIIQDNSIISYELNNVIYTDLHSLSNGMANNWEMAKLHLYEDILQKKIAPFGEEILNVCVRLKKNANRDVGVFKLIYALNENAPLTYKSKVYNNIEKLGKMLFEMLPEKDNLAIEMLLNGCLSFFLDINRYSVDIINRIEEIAEKIRGEGEKYYFELLYFLNPSCGYKVNDNCIKSLEELVVILENMDGLTREELSDKLINDEQFHVWVAFKGYEEQIKAWKFLYDNAEW